jgi:tetratricopeptide (TPR) repeat protein
VALLLVAVAVAAYWPALHAGWIWDDDSYVTANAVVQGADGWWRAWIPGQTPQWYPLVFVGFWLQHRVHGLDPFGYHLVNVLLHTLSAGLLWRVLARLGVRGAGVAAALFLLHPVQVESVAWVTERKNVLSMAFALLAVLAWVRARDVGGAVVPGGGQGAVPGGTAGAGGGRGASGADAGAATSGGRRWYALAACAFVCAMLSKTTAAAVPVALAAIEWWRGRRLTAGVGALLAGLFALAIAMGLATAFLEVTHVGASGAEFSRPFLERVPQAGMAWCFYAATWVWPVNLLFVYPPFERGPGDVWAWTACVGAGLVLAGAVAFARRGVRGPLALLAVYSAGVFPALGFLAVWPLRYAPVADHFGYVGGVAVAVALGWLAATAWAWLRARGAAAWQGGAAAAVVAGALAALTWQATLPYHDEETLWRWTLARNPRAWLAANNLASLRLAAARDARRAGDEATAWQALAEAEALALQAVETTGGTDMPALSNLSEALRLQGRMPEALAAAERAVAANPRYGGAHWLRARLLEQMGRPDEARDAYARAVELDPRNPLHLHDLMRVETNAGRLEPALAAARLLAAAAPGDAEAQGNLGNLLLATGRVVEARPALERALAIAPPALAAQIEVNLCDALLRPPVDSGALSSGAALAARLAGASKSPGPVPLLLLARAMEALGSAEEAARLRARADTLLEGADEPTRRAAERFRGASGVPASPGAPRAPGGPGASAASAAPPTSAAAPVPVPITPPASPP